MTTGLVLGLLIGIVTGTVFLLILRAANRLADNGKSAVVTFTAQLLSLPTFWVGGPWLTGRLLRQVDLAAFYQPYVIALLLSFSCFSLYPAARWIIQVGDEMGRAR